MNTTSSRSHAIFTIHIEVLDSHRQTQEGRQEEGERGVVHSYTHAKISLVDLAGSERAKRTGASGTRLKESVGINQVGGGEGRRWLGSPDGCAVCCAGPAVAGEGHSRTHVRGSHQRGHQFRAV